MSQKSKNKSKPSPAKKATVKQVKPLKGKSDGLLSHRAMLLCLIVITFIAFLPVFKAGFVSWDDPDYVTSNNYIKSISNLKEIVTVPVQGNYHPLTMLSLALNYSVSGKNAWSYHLVNLLLHLVNIILVFFFIYRLTGKKQWIAFITALLFGIHPLHVESVAWVAERKDVLYSLFFLCGLITYLKYLDNKKITTLLGVAGLFILSLLSKPAAVIFPLVLLSLDYFYGRLKDYRIWLEKIPFFILSLIMGLLTVHAQSLQGAVAQAGAFPVHFRFFFGFYGLMMYFIKTVLPLSLCTFYPFPAINEALPFIYYIAPLFALALIVLLIVTLKKQKLIAFSILFYLINLILVLQFMPVGSAVIADRYTYLPLIGVFIIPAFYFQKWADKNKGKPPMSGIILISFIAIILTVLSFLQASTWKDSATLWDKAIAVAPSSRAYTNRGLAYKVAGDKEKALEMYTKAISINKKEPDALMNRGNIYFDLGKDSLALKDYRKSMTVKKKNPKLFANIGSILGRQEKYDSALYYLNTSMALDSSDKGTYLVRGLCLSKMKKYSESNADYSHYLRMDPENDKVISGIGINYQGLKNFRESIIWFEKAIQVNPNEGSYYLDISYSYYSMNDTAKARENVLKAKKLGVVIPEAYKAVMGL